MAKIYLHPTIYMSQAKALAAQLGMELVVRKFKVVLESRCG